MKQQDVDWFRPLWRRVAVTVFVAIWCVIEWWRGEQFWGTLTGLALIYAVWSLFISYDRGKNGPQG